MYREVCDELSARAEQRRMRDGLLQQQAALQEALAQQQGQLAAAWQKAQQESADVAALQSLSVKSVFARLKNSHGEELVCEQQQARRAELEMLQVKADVEATQGEIATVQSQLETMGDVDGRYADALRRKAEALSAADGPAAKELSSLIDEIANARAWNREFHQAGQVGTRVLGLIDHAVTRQRQSLPSGVLEYQDDRNWDHEEMVFAEGQRSLAAANSALLRFKAELADVHQHFHIPYALDAGPRHDDARGPWVEEWSLRRQHRPTLEMRTLVVDALRHLHLRHVELGHHLASLWRRYEELVEHS